MVGIHVALIQTLSLRENAMFMQSAWVRRRADNGYKDPKYFIYPAAYPNTAQSQSRIRARHETVNKRLKQWNVLVHAFSHDISKHIRCCHAVVNVTQIMIQSGEKLFDI